VFQESADQIGVWPPAGFLSLGEEIRLPDGEKP
jgi:hypothetical protein